MLEASERSNSGATNMRWCWLSGKKPPSVFFTVIGIGYHLMDVQRSKIPDPYRFVNRARDNLFAIWWKCGQCDWMCMALQHLHLVAHWCIPDPHWVVKQARDNLFAIWWKCNWCDWICMALQHLQLVACWCIPDPHCLARGLHQQLLAYGVGRGGDRWGLTWIKIFKHYFVI